MNLQTKITIAAPDFSIDYNSKLMMLGSCFAENMGGKFSYYKFDVDVNPCGIIYNPLSVANVLRLIMEGKPFGKDDLRKVGEKWVSLYHHGAFSSTDQEECLDKILLSSGRVFASDKRAFGEGHERTSFFRFIGNHLGDSVGVQAYGGKYDRVELSQDPFAGV